MERARIPLIRTLAVGFTIGALLAGASLAGVVVDPLGIGSGSTPDPVAPVGVAPRPAPVAASSDGAPGSADAGDEEILPEEIPAAAAGAVTAPAGPRLPDGEFLVGAARASLYPSPQTFGGTTWQTEGCTVYGDSGFGNLNTDHALASMEDMAGWPAASPDCVYLGGYGLGPVRPAQRVGQGGIWVRAIAVSNGASTFVYAIADTVGWFARYDADVCPTNDCGILDVRTDAAADLGIPIDNVIVGSTHTHAGADTYGGWGGIPTWYRAQLREAAVAAVKQAVANLEPAAIRVGETHLRSRNNERRDTYYSTTDTGATWLQAQRPADNSVIATWSTFAGHPTIVGDPILHADWPGATARRLEARYGGVGLLFEGGLGNVSISGAGGATDEIEAENTGIRVANDIIADVDRGTGQLASNTMTAATKVITHPAATNPALTTLAMAGLFDREFTPGTPGAGLPGEYSWSKRGETSTAGEENDPEAKGEVLRSCVSAGPTIITAAGAHRIGEFAVAFGPGELFSNLTEVVKERADSNTVAMVLGQTNDALGYIIQDFEYDTAANAVTEYGTQTHEYEEVFSIDRCFGDHVLETILESTRALGFGG